MDREERKKTLKNLRLLVMARDIKFVVKGKKKKVNDKYYMSAQYYFVEPFDISQPVKVDNLKKIRVANLKHNKHFIRASVVEFEHPFSAGAYKFEGPVMTVCYEKMLETLGNEQVQDFIKTGAVFTVRKKNVPDDLEKRTATVKMAIYQPVDKERLLPLRKQDVIMDKTSYSVKAISDKLAEFKQTEKGK